jgi:hypothetical protein
MLFFIHLESRRVGIAWIIDELCGKMGDGVR